MKGGGGVDGGGDGDEEECRPWRRRLLSSMAVSSWSGAFRISLLVLLLIGIATAFVTLPVEKVHFSISVNSIENEEEGSIRWYWYHQFFIYA